MASRIEPATDPKKTHMNPEPDADLHSHKTSISDLIALSKLRASIVEYAYE